MQLCAQGNAGGCYGVLYMLCIVDFFKRLFLYFPQTVYCGVLS